MIATDVIAAIATPIGKAAIGVVRLSGAGTLEVLARVFRPKKREWASHTVYHGYIRDGSQNIDEVMCCYMRAPRSYTREDTAEIYTHGGMNTLRGVLETVLRNGARPALPGEFTQRAFLNGRMDLAQAEAVMTLINAKTDAAARASLRQLGGGLSGRIATFRNRVLTWIAHIELSIDYPEHGGEAMNLHEIEAGCGALLTDMEKLLATARVGRVLTEGVRTAIIGRPNVGKSSLLNAILSEDRAIVTDIPGTTRDVLSEAVNLRGVPLVLSDTAGIRDTEDIIEKQGVEKSEAQAAAADLVILVFDSSASPQPEDAALLERFGGTRRTLVLLNKCDLPIADGWLPEVGSFLHGEAQVLPVSAKTGDGLDKLYRTLEEMFLEGFAEADAADTDILTNERHRFLLEKGVNHLRAAVAAVQSGVTEDLISVDLTAAYRALGEIIGAEVGDDIADRIFSEFCVGK